MVTYSQDRHDCEGPQWRHATRWRIWTDGTDCLKDEKMTRRGKNPKGMSSVLLDNCFNINRNVNWLSQGGSSEPGPFARGPLGRRGSFEGPAHKGLAR